MAEQANVEVKTMLTQSQKRVVELESKLVTLTAQAKKGGTGMPVSDTTASLDSAK